MVSKQSVFILLASFHLMGESPAYLVNVGYQSPKLIAPAVILIIPRNPHKLFQIGMVGWTILAKGEYRFHKNLSLGFSQDVTPFNSNASIYQFTNGERDQNLDYENSTCFTQVYSKWKHDQNFSTQVSALLLKEKVDGLTDNVESFWKNPYIGISFTESFRMIVYEDFFNNRWDGIKASVQYQYFMGEYLWYKGFLSGGFGKIFNSSQIMVSGKYFFSRNLNKVNRFIVGGSWELEMLNFLPGSHYGEYRIDDGILFNVRFDQTFLKNLNIGIRSGFLFSGVNIHYGYGIKIMSVFKGIVIHFCVGIPGKSIQYNYINKTIISGGITFGYI